MFNHINVNIILPVESQQNKEKHFYSEKILESRLNS